MERAITALLFPTLIMHACMQGHTCPRRQPMLEELEQWGRTIIVRKSEGRDLLAEPRLHATLDAGGATFCTPSPTLATLGLQRLDFGLTPRHQHQRFTAEPVPRPLEVEQPLLVLRRQLRALQPQQPGDLV